MIGAIAGDIIGSVYEAEPIKTKDFPLFTECATFTDDTVLTVAVAEVLARGSDYTQVFKAYVRRHPYRGYGGNFVSWALSPETTPYGSFGNGSAMRVSPVGWARNSEERVLEEARWSAEVTHHHPEGIKGAQATAIAIYLARNGRTKSEIKTYLENQFGYKLDRSLALIRPHYRFDVSCQGSVPESIICFLESNDYEDAVRNAVSLGGDSDTMACIAGGIAEAFYGGVPENIKSEILRRLDRDLKAVISEFLEKFSACYLINDA